MFFLNNKNLDKKQKIIQVVLFTLAIFIIGVVMYVLYTKFDIGFHCVFRSITGLRCPGCGNTHVVVSLLKLDILTAFKYNLLFPIEFGYIAYVYVCWAIKHITGKRCEYPVIDIICLGIILAWFIVRNILGI